MSEMPDAQKRGSSIRTRDLLAELRCKLAMNGRRMYADFLEHAAMHHAHDAAATLFPSMIGPLPGRANELARGHVSMGRGSRQIRLQLFERGADLVAQGFEPGTGRLLAGLEQRVCHLGVCHGAWTCSRRSLSQYAG